MMTANRTQWTVWVITVYNRDGIWHWRETDPAEAIAKARMQQFTPPLNDRFTEKNALGRLIDGETLTVWCLDGTLITIHPIHL